MIRFSARHWEASLTDENPESRSLPNGARNISAALDNPSFETKQKILRLVERVEFVEDEIAIKHVLPISGVGSQRDQYSDSTPNMENGNDLILNPHGCPNGLETMSENLMLKPWF
jgi:hypothetical protein